MFRRRNYLIKKQIQIGFFYRFAVLAVLEAALIFGLFMYISTGTITVGYYDSVLSVKHTPGFFFIPFLFIVLIVFIGISMAAMIVFILVSHRVAGPLYRLERTLGEIVKGDLTKRISLRKTDKLMELKEILNVLMESFDQRLGRIKINLTELKDLLAKNDPANSDKIYKAIELLKHEIDHFKVTSGSRE